MDVRSKLDNIHHLLEHTKNKTLFGVVSLIHPLSHPPIPLDTAEMHKMSADIIRQAKYEVLLAFYKFAIDSTGGKEIFLALIDLKLRAERDQTKINVCILVNRGGTVAELFSMHYSSIEITGLEKSDYFNIIQTPHDTALFGILNTKIIIVDSEIAMIRGGDPDTLNDLLHKQIETATLLRGSIVLDMRRDYNEVWLECFKKPLDEIRFINEAKCEVNSVNPISFDLIPCIFLSKRENGNPLSMYHKNSVSPYKIALLQAISDSAVSIHIMTSNLNDTDICLALARACCRGVSVNIITGKRHNDFPESWWGGTNFNSLAYLVSEVAPEFQTNLRIRWATNPSGKIVYPGEKFTLNAKYVCIDEELVFIGSSPLDLQAMQYSREADVVFLHKPTANAFGVKFFFEKFNQGKDYFEEAYSMVRTQIEEQIIRIKRVNTDTSNDKCDLLNAALAMVNIEKCSPREKLYLLIEKTIPSLQIPTGYKPGMPRSYNTVIACITMYGLDKHFNIQVQRPEQEMALSGQEAETVINRHFLIPSNSASHSTRKRASSDISSTSPDLDDNGQNNKLDLRKSM